MDRNIDKLIKKIDRQIDGQVKINRKINLFFFFIKYVVVMWIYEEDIFVLLNQIIIVFNFDYFVLVFLYKMLSSG